ncbi:HNH endonuclease signature motif containing protein [Mycolicibacterium mengxianglii]|uniref:HNH endonuclease signature motif containing protein n=1 Tax=Mycolicibacterium mengxianglii TaxID=2736649 RepID=UPI0018EF04D1|nr:HNH endonuclease signature motif containing protein [Mycolicibacterium mengxianglii]
MFESSTPSLRSHLVTRIVDAARAAAQCQAEMLVSIGELFRARLAEFGECEDYAVDTYAAVAAEVAATLRCSLAMGSSHLRYALAMQERLPQVGRVFEGGGIDYDTFKRIVFRTDLIVDDGRLASADEHLALAAPRWGTLSRGKLDKAIDKAVAKADPDAVRRRAEDSGGDRYVEICETDAGVCEIRGRAFDVVGRALDKRLDELAATVCDQDPRTKDQRRTDALQPLADRADRLACRCGLDACPMAGMKPPRTGIVIHVVAEQATLEGSGDAPGYTFDADSLIPAELLRELAAVAKQVPVIPPVDAVPESSYVPSKALADFVRCRDLTCRAPGCDKPATSCELDHTVPYADGGATHASNIKCLCVTHHLLKTFCGWRDLQLPDGTIVWTLPGGQVYVTTPGSALLFPGLSAPTGVLSAAQGRGIGKPGTAAGLAERMAKMPRRSRTRRQNRDAAIAEERRLNQQSRQAAREKNRKIIGPHAGEDCPDEDPPPF